MFNNLLLRLLLATLLGVLSSIALAAEVPAAGSNAPGFTLSDQHGAQRQLSDWRGKWLVLYFYPKDDTPGCTAEACSFRDDLQQISKLGAQVVGISIDAEASHKAFAEKYHLPFPLLADVNGEVAAKYGALSNWVVMKVAKRYTFLIDPTGRIAKVYLSVDTSRHSAEIVNDLKQFSQAGR